MQRVSNTDHDIMIFRTVPRHSSCCLVRLAFFSFLWQGWLGCRCPPPAIQKYPQSSAWEAEGRFGAFSNAWYHDIRHSIMFLNIQHYIQRASKADHYISFHCVLWCPSIFHDIPIWSMSFQDRQTFMVFHMIPLNCSTLHDIPIYAVTFPQTDIARYSSKSYDSLVHAATF